MNRPTAVTMKDIANELGISIVTVSRAFHNFPDIASETKARILKRARELNYRPNLMARSLVTGRSSLIGLVVPDLIHPFYSEVAKSLSAVLRTKNYFVMLSSSENDPLLECEEIDHMLAHHLDCFVVASCQRNTDSLKQIVDSGVPLVLLDRNLKNFACNFVCVDYYRVGELAAQHFVEQGFRRTAQICGPATEAANNRLTGFVDTIRGKGLSVREDRVIFTDETDTDYECVGSKAMDRLLCSFPRPDAVFCCNDAVAIGAMERTLEAGLKIPTDVAFVGCGSFHYCDKLRVPLSSVDQKPKLMGESAANMVKSILVKRSGTRFRSVVLEPELIVRESSRAS